MRDSDWLAAYLSDGLEHELSAIIRRSQEVRGYGLTVHSRVSDLRRAGHTIMQRSVVVDGRRRSYYRMVSPMAERAA
jgi:hypothetical protein